MNHYLIKLFFCLLMLITSLPGECVDAKQFTNGLEDKNESSFGFMSNPLRMASSPNFNYSLTQASVPIGTIIDWWAQEDKNVPNGFALCNGDKVTDPNSPLFNRVLPNLHHIFTRGTINKSEVGMQGGDNNFEFEGVITSISGSHMHGFYEPTTGFITQGTEKKIETTQKINSLKGKEGFCRCNYSPAENFFQAQHKHELPISDGTVPHSHTIKINVDVLPPYINFFKIIRIK